MESLNPGATAPSPPTHTSIPEAKQSLAPPHPGKGRRGFLEEQGLRLCELREGVRCSVLGVGPFAGRFAWLCVDAEILWNRRWKWKRKEIRTDLCRVSWSWRTWK